MDETVTFDYEPIIMKFRLDKHNGLRTYGGMDGRMVEWVKGVRTRVERNGGWEIWLWLSRLYGATTPVQYPTGGYGVY